MRRIVILLGVVVGLSALAQEAPKRLPPAAKMKIRLGETKGDAAALLDPSAKAWETAEPTRVLLNRTPRVYQTEQPRLEKPPALEVRALRALRAGERALFRLVWEDATKNAPEAPPKRAGEGGDPAKLYKRPTEHTSAFADAAAVMVPDPWSGGAFPSLVMGDGKRPVRLYYWNASRGTDQLTASGRARVESTGKAVRHQAHYADRRWAVTLELPGLPAGSPVAFAVWDGEVADRDGMKCFSAWYVLE
jgi:hypothetical protein